MPVLGEASSCDNLCLSSPVRRHRVVVLPTREGPIRYDLSESTSTLPCCLMCSFTVAKFVSAVSTFIEIIIIANNHYVFFSVQLPFFELRLFFYQEVINVLSAYNSKIVFYDVRLENW